MSENVDFNSVIDSVDGYDPFDESDIANQGGLDIKKVGMVAGIVFGGVIVIFILMRIFLGTPTAGQPEAEDQSPQSAQSSEQAAAPEANLEDGEIIGKTKDGWEGITPPDHVREQILAERRRQMQEQQQMSGVSLDGGESTLESPTTNSGGSFTYVKPKTSLDGNADPIALHATAQNYGRALYTADGEVVSALLSRRCSLPVEEAQAYVTKFRDAVGSNFKTENLNIEISKPRLGVSFVRYTPNGNADLSEEVYFLWDRSEGKWVMDSCNN